MNESFVKYGMTDYTFIIPTGVLLSLEIGLIKFGEEIYTYTMKEQLAMASYFGLNNFDSTNARVDYLALL